LLYQKQNKMSKGTRIVTDQDREIVYFNYMKMSNKEIAKTFSMPQHTVNRIIGQLTHQEMFVKCDFFKKK
jgi:hypothetical protein